MAPATDPGPRAGHAETPRRAPADDAGADGGDDRAAAMPASAQQAAQEVIGACGRVTAGSLDDLAGLHAIKQLLREARTAYPRHLLSCWLVHEMLITSSTQSSAHSPELASSLPLLAGSGCRLY